MSLSRQSRAHGAVPSAQQLGDDAARHLAGGALVVLAVAVVHRFGYPDQQWPYVAMAAALVPQVLVDLLALGDQRRRARLRTSGGPAWPPLLVAVVLAFAAPLATLSGGPAPTATAALLAAAGLAVAAAPVTVTVAPRARGPARSVDR